MKMGTWNIPCGPHEMPQEHLKVVYSTESIPDFAETSNISSNDPPEVELKLLLTTLRYDFLGINQTYPIIVNSNKYGNVCHKFYERSIYNMIHNIVLPKFKNGMFAL
jgi:hypothetical protein